MSQLNTSNFFRWYTGSAVDESVNLPRLGIADNKCYMPCVVSGERAGFYLNADIPFYDNDTESDLKLRLNDGTVIATIVHKVALDTGYRIYCDFSFPVKPLGQYYYEIYNATTNTSKCISNYFRVIDPIEADTSTVLVEWRNSRDAFYYEWSKVPDLALSIRLNMSLGSYTPEGTIDQTKAVSTGRRRNNNYDIDFSIRLQTYYFDDGANMACIPLFTSDGLIINGRKYVNKTIYAPNVRPTSKVAIGEVELYDQQFSTINKYGPYPQLIAPTIKSNPVVLLNVTENASPYVDANGLIRINTTDKDPIIVTGNRSYVVAGDSTIRAFAYCETTTANAKITLTGYKNNAQVYYQEITATAGNQIYWQFTATGNDVFIANVAGVVNS